MNTPFSLARAETATMWQSSSGAELQSELQEALADRELLLNELTHRVRNTLQLIGSLLKLQERRVVDVEAQRALTAARERVLAIAGVYKGLDRGEIGRIEFGQYLRDLCAQLPANFAGGPSRITLAVDAERGMLDLDHAVPLGLVANELIGAALASRVEKNAAGKITVHYGTNGQGQHRLAVGARFPAIAVASDGLALDLVRAFVQQIEGTLTIEQNPDLHVTVTFRTN